MPEGLPEGPGGLTKGLPEGLAGAKGGQMDIQIDRQMEFLRILKDFIP